MELTVPARRSSFAGALRSVAARDAALALLSVSLLAGPAAAQSLQIGTSGGWMSTWSDGRPTSGLFPAVWVDRHGVGTSLGGNFSLDLDGHRASSTTTASGPLGLVLEVGARRTDSAWPGAGRAGALSTRLHWTGSMAGAWLATSGFQADRTRGVLPLLGAGAWMERGRLTFATQLIHLLAPVREQKPPPATAASRDSERTEVPTGLGVVPPGTGEDIRLMTGAETSLRWGQERMDLQLRSGFAVGPRHQPAYWGELRAGYRVRPGLDVFARARRATGVPEPLEVASQYNAALGMQLAIGPSPALPIKLRARAPDFRVQSLGGSRHRLEFRAEGSGVEVSSDANEWAPIVATRAGADRWEVELDLSPGVHRIAIRVNGGPWRAPAGLPTALDDFGGEVGLIVVE